jgi:integrase
MKVIQIKTEGNLIRYYLADENGVPVEPVIKFLKFKDNTGYARNTLRMYCTHLKHYFTYLEARKRDFEVVNIDDLAGFVAWLQNPYIYQKVVPLLLTPARKPQTVNIIVDTVIAFYDYLSRHELYEGKLSQALVKFIRHPGRNYRGFLYGIAKTKEIKSHVLKLRVPQSKIKVLTKMEASELLNNCTNLRDYFLLYILFETGMRIGEVLALWLEDFDSCSKIIDLKDRGELENLSEIKTVSSPRRLDITQELLDLFMEYICTYHTDMVKTNHIFVKLKGEKSGSAMDYTDVDNLFRVLRTKTGIAVTPHMFRHTSLSLLYSVGWAPELLRKRAGHKNIYTTINTYVHPSDDEISKAFHAVSEQLKPKSDEVYI